MNQQAAHRSRKCLSSDRTWLLEIGSGKTPYTPQGVLNSLPELRENLSLPCVRIELGLERRHLLGTQLPAFRVSQQTVEAAHDVPQVKGDRRDTRRASIQRFVAQQGTRLLHVLHGELQGMHHRTDHSRKIGVRARSQGSG